MKKLTTLALAAAMVMGAATCASAIDFKAKGQWQFGFNVGDASMTNKFTNVLTGERHHTDTKDIFGARQRVRLQLDAVASEALSGTVFFEIGHQYWGNGDNGAALGADGMVVKVRQAYLDWVVPQTDLKIRMGIQNLSLPSVAGDGNILDNTDTAAIVASYQFNENVGATLMWARPYNDNFGGASSGRTAGALDNIDLFMLSVPLTFDGVEVTPWVMYGMIGKNAFNPTRKTDEFGNYYYTSTEPGKTGVMTGEGLGNYPLGYAGAANRSTGKGYASAFWFGLPIKVTAFDPLNVELDINYGYVEKLGRYDVVNGYNPAKNGRASTKREGWLVKALVEYKMDWGTPGIFGWYASGDDKNIKNGSERMPYLYAEQKFTSMLGEDVAYTGGHTDMKLSLDGSWGIGLQVKDLSFVEDLKHTLRVAYYGGTNDHKVLRYAYLADNMFNDNGQFDPRDVMTNPWAMNKKDLYLTDKDAILEFNVNSYYQIYENLKMGLELAYAVNMMDSDTWSKATGASYSRQDMWSADLTFTYSF